MSYMKNHAIDLENQNKKLQDEVKLLQMFYKNLNDDREVVYNTTKELANYIDENDELEKEYLYEMIAKIQRFSV